ncbi:NADP-dependent oxidoreductase [Salinigranum rubrum]|uniref:NADP-dependent oxidoreductase n=1 Tax=Salinigranum rubrum TaxID=755307 RepID=A0A2I8VHK7_9EURY|nr:NADP-dependent oxidoreductase [Salinigranum rubrum]AUV81405.1 NADP-dependent oxidoreductase [Salinigranum rubrum]
MKAIQLQKPEGIETLTYDDVPRPEPDRHELRVQVHAAGINPIDWLMCRGDLSHLLDREVPWTPGWDVSGVIEAVGANVTGFNPGDTVCGMARLPGGGGAFAEYITMRSDELTDKPQSLSHLEAAGVPMAGQTAFHALYEEGNLGAGQRVLIHAAAGGVGHMAAQFAANTGAHVIGTASGRNEAFLRELGVDKFVNYRHKRFEDVVDDVDVVLDAVGGDVLERSVEIVQPGGIVVTLPEPPSERVVERYNEHGVDVSFFDAILDSDPATLRRVAAHADSEVVAPRISGTYPLSEVQDALERSADGHVRGKLVVDLTADADD